MDEDEYESVTKRPLNLIKDKSKSKKKKTKAKQLQDHLAGVSTESKVIITTNTNAEKAFKTSQSKIAEERILKKASKTHKQRVEEFNKHLDSLSEHYDIPKVSWTK